MASDKSFIRRELFRCALAGEFLFYSEFRDRLWPGLSGWRKEWSEDLDTISREETDNGYPDLTFLLRKKENRYPSRIGFRDAKPPDVNQKVQAHNAANQIIALYCPAGTTNP